MSSISKTSIFSRRQFILYLFLVFTSAFMGIRLAIGFLKRKQVVSNVKTPLSPFGQRTLQALYPTMCDDADSESIKSSLHEIHQYLENLSRRTQIELELALAFINQGTLFWGYLRPFPFLEEKQKYEFLMKLQNGPRILAPIFLGLKELCFLGYYAQENNFKHIPGYSTTVPFSGDPDPEYNQEYELLKAKE